MSFERPSPPARRRAGFALVGLGIVVILASVVYVLEMANGPGTGPKRFEERRTYDMVKESVHETFPMAFAIGIAGLGIAMCGGRLARPKRPPSDTVGPTDPPGSTGPRG
jgi:hypothetical protein